MMYEIGNINEARASGVCESAGGTHGVGMRPLGIVTKNCSPPIKSTAGSDEIDFDTGEVLQPRDSLKVRSERWAMKSVVNRLLPNSRTSKCMVLRSPIPHYGLMPIEIYKSRKTGKAFYHGLMTCGSVWTCPVCNPKISSRRRNELSEAILEAKKQNLGVFLVTLTVPHGIGDDISDLLLRLQKALRVMSSGKNSLKSYAERIGFCLGGYIRTLEVTYGQNGFHPHYHILQFVEPLDPSGSPVEVSPSIVQYVYLKAWKRACKSAGLPEPSNEKGVDVRDGSYASEYVTKWGVEDEMTKTISKQGKRNGLTPWGLLRAILDDDSSSIEPSRAASVFRVYADAFKNKRQLFWSIGLRKKLLPQNVELSDKDLIDQEQDELSDLLSGISEVQWKKIRSYNKEADVLNVAESGTPQSLKFLLDFIMSLPDRKRSSPVSLSISPL